uniref:Putative secreted peptide n=1 Tax=Anopheles braziliensis TaxID=58242 RepID=A0A2M3ZQI1_9DIPT
MIGGGPRIVCWLLLPLLLDPVFLVAVPLLFVEAEEVFSFNDVSPLADCRAPSFDRSVFVPFPKLDGAFGKNAVGGAAIAARPGLAPRRGLAAVLDIRFSLGSLTVVAAGGSCASGIGFRKSAASIFTGTGSKSSMM